jgi:CRP-like cAMP-binding protein
MDYIVLTGIPLFRGVSSIDLERIFNKLKIGESYFKKGDILAMQDEQVNRLIILLEGSVKGEMMDSFGKVVKVEDIEAPNPLAILFLFGEHNRYPVQAMAKEDVKVVIIPKQSVLKMLSMNEDILKNYLDISADFASRLSRKLHFMSFKTIRQKIAVYLLQLSKKINSNTITLDKTKVALAEYFGVSRQSLEREITHMQNDGLIDSRGKEIVIIQRDKLSKLML